MHEIWDDNFDKKIQSDVIFIWPNKKYIYDY